MMLRGGCLAFQGRPGVAEQRGVTLPKLQLEEGQQRGVTTAFTLDRSPRRVNENPAWPSLVV